MDSIFSQVGRTSMRMKWLYTPKGNLKNGDLKKSASMKLNREPNQEAPLPYYGVMCYTLLVEDPRLIFVKSCKVPSIRHLHRIPHLTVQQTLPFAFCILLSVRR